MAELDTAAIRATPVDMAVVFGPDGLIVRLCDEVDRLRAGADCTPPAEGTWPTPAQWIGLFLADDAPRRLERAQQVITNAATAADCWAFGHVSRLENADRLNHRLNVELAETRRRELDNHHNAAACPYCSPHIEAAARQRDDALVLLRQMEHYVGPYGDRVREFLAGLAVQSASKPGGNPVPATIPYLRRLAACVAAWPEAESGAYNPACCRFPKSCSPYPFGPVDGGELEPMPAWGVEPEDDRTAADVANAFNKRHFDVDPPTFPAPTHPYEPGAMCRGMPREHKIHQAADSQSSAAGPGDGMVAKAARTPHAYELWDGFCHRCRLPRDHEVHQQRDGAAQGQEATEFCPTPGCLAKRGHRGDCRLCECIGLGGAPCPRTAGWACVTEARKVQRQDEEPG